nr:Asp23/Gls24 family envelope stress response protein [Lachnospiraceae bacterium]
MAKDKQIFEIKDGVVATEEVMAIIAGIAATEADGISSLEGNLTGANITKAGMGKLQKGIRVVSNDDESISVHLALNIKYGCEIPSVCKNVQEKVKSTVENMT